MEHYEPTVTVYAEAFEKSIRHGMELWWSDSTPKKRLDQRDGVSQFTRYVNNRVVGKLAEVAFSKFLLYDYGIDSQVDWRIYGDYNVTDEGDLQYLVGDDGEHYPPAVEVDVKKTKPWNQWLALRSEIFERHPDNAPFVLTKLSLEDDMDVDEWEDAENWKEVSNDLKFRTRFNDYVTDHFPMDVDIVGSAYKSDFTDEFEQGDRLYDPDTGKSLGGPLRRDNYGIHVSDLDTSIARWNRIVDEITDDYPITYGPL